VFNEHKSDESNSSDGTARVKAEYRVDATTFAAQFSHVESSGKRDPQRGKKRSREECGVIKLDRVNTVHFLMSIIGVIRIPNYVMLFSLVKPVSLRNVNILTI
jgi:hypothetical protein